MHFTHDWFSHNIEAIQHSVSKAGDVNKILEIGSYEGKSTCWFIENLLSDGGDMVCIDAWQPTEEHKNLTQDVYKTFSQNLQEVEKPHHHIHVMVGHSYDCLANLIVHTQDKLFDMIYVDGSHTAYHTLADMTMSWGLLRVGGIMIIDDYLWNVHYPDYNHPKPAIDSFMRCYHNQYDIVAIGYQVHLKKKEITNAN